MSLPLSLLPAPGLKYVCTDYFSRSIYQQQSKRSFSPSVLPPRCSRKRKTFDPKEGAVV